MSTAAGEDREGEAPTPRPPRTAAAGPTRLACRVTDTPAGEELTLFPPEATGVDLMSRWVTAGAGSWVTLTEMR